MEMQKKIAYLQGLTEGLEVKGSSREGRILSGIVDLLGEMSNTITDLEEYVETIDEDLFNLEEDAYDSSDSEDTDYEEYMEVQCPKCHELVYFETDILEDDDVIEVTCPNCDEVVFVNDETEVVGYVDEDYLSGKSLEISDTEDI